MSLDRDTVRNLIVDLRDRRGMSFGSIRDTMKNEYGYEASRQAICGIYKRAKAAMEKRPEIEKAQYNCGVLVANLLARGYTTSDLEKEPVKYGLPAGYEHKAMHRALEAVPKLRDKAYESIVAEFQHGIMAGKSLEDMRESARYGGIDVTDKQFVRAIADAHVQLIRGKVVDYLKQEYVTHGDRETVREILDRLKLDISVYQICGSDCGEEDAMGAEGVTD